MSHGSVKSFLRFFIGSWFYPLTLVVVVVVDQISKLWVKAALSRGGQIEVIEGFLDFVYTTNTGVAFGLSLIHI